MIVKHWVGIINKAVFQDETKLIDGFENKIRQWAAHWQRKAAFAELRNSTLVVFEIPKDAEKELVAAIEQFLQDRPETKVYQEKKV